MVAFDDPGEVLALCCFFFCFLGLICLGLVPGG